jgi:hypothetical protein
MPGRIAELPKPPKMEFHSGWIFTTEHIDEHCVQCRSVVYFFLAWLDFQFPAIFGNLGNFGNQIMA